MLGGSCGSAPQLSSRKETPQETPIRLAMVKINLFLNKGKLNKRGEAPVLLTFTSKRKKRRFYTSVSVNPKYWDFKRQVVKPSHVHCVRLNMILGEFKNTAEDIYAAYQATHNLQAPDLETLAALFEERLDKSASEELDNPGESTLAALKRFINSRLKSRSKNTSSKYTKLLRDLTDSKFWPLDFNELKPEVFNEYRQLLVVAGNNDSTIAKYLSQLRTFLRWCEDEGLLTDPKLLKKLVINEPSSPHKATLTMSEVRRLSNHVFEKEALAKVRDVFCFACYTGLRYSDLRQLKKPNLKEDETGHFELHLVIEKTRVPLAIPLPEPALRILQRYSLPSGHLLPVVSNQGMNVKIKEACRLAGINTLFEKVSQYDGKLVREQLPKWAVVTTHTARRTFATISVEHGISLGIVSQILGHSSIKQTQDYIKQVSRDAVKAVKEVWND